MRILVAIATVILICGCLCLSAVGEPTSSAGAATASTTGVASAPWHHPLYLGNDGYWRQRIAVTVRNDGDRPAAGDPVELRIGSGAGEADLIGVLAQAVRVCDANGTEMLYRIAGPSSQMVTAGAIPAGATFFLPVECPPKQTATYYIYFDNPQSWEVPDFLQQPAAGKETAKLPGLAATAAPREQVNLRLISAATQWYDDNPSDDLRWEYRAPLTAVNVSDAAQQALIQVDFSRVLYGFSGGANRDSIRVTDGARIVPHILRGDALLFEGAVPARTVRTYYAYFSLDKRIPDDPATGYAGLLAGPCNLVRNPSFEDGTPTPTEWRAAAEGTAADAAGLDAPGRFGARSIRVRIPQGAAKATAGWQQRVPVSPGQTYLYAAWAKCQDAVDAPVRIRADYYTAAAESKPIRSVVADTSIKETQDWRLLHGLFVMPKDVVAVDLRLGLTTTGTAWFDGALFAAVVGGVAAPLEFRPDGRAPDIVIWPVNAVVKVFQDDGPPRAMAPARISVAHNEREPLQLAVRSAKRIDGVTVEVDPPTNARGEPLRDIEIEVVGFVPVDHRTAYYQERTPAWYRKYPRIEGSGDGWPGMWPDPLLPRNRFDLAPNTTQPVWVTVAVPKTAPAGDYTGAVRLVSRGTKVGSIPFTVHVWGFQLPDEAHVAAIYDLRVGGQWDLPGKTRDQTYLQLLRFMAEHRLCPDGVQPEPVIKYENGQAVTDFAAFDRAAEYYFGTLKLPRTYSPGCFYGFGWGHPVDVKFGEKAYDGEYPYANVDRGKFRPEFKRAYQACLKAYWDHMKQKGWADKFELYLSDEPYPVTPIREQMKALCDMIHEVDRKIPVYVSTLTYRPYWKGYIDVWGVLPHGAANEQEMAEIRNSGARLWYSTDGQLCSDTPYCAIERLLPHYCFRYGADAYEFWGLTWLTYDPYRFGWHSYIPQSMAPGEEFWIRYPNGDGYLAYPGGPIGYDGPVSSVRLEQAREGVEDYEYFYLLRQLIAEAKGQGKDVAAAEQALQTAAQLCNIPNPGGRFSSQILRDPDDVLRVKEAVAGQIEKLSPLW